MTDETKTESKEETTELAPVVADAEADAIVVADKKTEILEAPPHVEDLVVIARDPDEVTASQARLIKWAEQKAALSRAELKEAEENLEHAKRTKLRTGGWKNQVVQARRRVDYYEKIKSALSEGYFLFPDCPSTIIAVRTSREAPRETLHKGGPHTVSDVRHGHLPEGEGRYVSPQPVVSTFSNREERTNRDGEKYEVDQSYSHASDFDDVDFPFKRVKPQILADLDTAMKKKIFDEIGVVPPTRSRNRDPMIVGRISRRIGYQEISATFLISWWVDTRDL